MASISRFNWLKLLLAWCLGLIVCASFGCHSDTPVVSLPKEEAKDRLAELVDTFPVVEWDVGWEVNRERPGYPLLDSTEHFVVQSPGDDAGIYHHHPQITFFRGKYFATWSNHPLGESGPGQKVVGAMSEDGKKWSSLGVVIDSLDAVGETSVMPGRALIASPMIVARGRLYAVGGLNDITGFGPAGICQTDPPVQQERTDDCRQRMRDWLGYVLREIRSDGTLGPEFWVGDEPLEALEGQREINGAKPPKPVMDEIESTLMAAVTASPWDCSHAEQLQAEDGSYLCEPAAVQAGDLTIRYLRDLSLSKYVYVQFSFDDGKTWSKAKRTEIPDAPSKVTFGKIEEGPFFLIGNQAARKKGCPRDPITIALSDDGTQFNDAYAIRWRAPKLQLESQQAEKDGRGRGFQYPSFCIAKGKLWVIYSVNKEGIEVTSIDLSELRKRHQH